MSEIDKEMDRSLKTHSEENWSGESVTFEQKISTDFTWKFHPSNTLIPVSVCHSSRIGTVIRKPFETK